MQKNLQDPCPIHDMFVSLPILLSHLACFASEWQGVLLTAIVTGFRVICVPLPPSLNCGVHNDDSLFLQESIIHSLASGLLAVSVPNILIKACNFRVPL